MKEILITGANSYVGARLYFDLKEKYKTTGTYHKNRLSDSFVQLDTTNPQEIHDLVSRINPNTIIHVAANASAKWCEEHPEEARDLNERATKSVVDVAKSTASGVIFISSFAAEDTSNVYGQTKAASEEIIKEGTEKYVILRPSLVIGFSPNTQNDRPFNRILKNLDGGIPAVYDTSWKFQPTYISHLSQVISLVIDRDLQGETIPVAVASLKSRFDIANDILSEFNVVVEPEDKHDQTPVIENDLQKLKDLGLPLWEYDEMIKAIISEIRNRDKFKI